MPGCTNCSCIYVSAQSLQTLLVVVSVAILPISLGTFAVQCKHWNYTFLMQCILSTSAKSYFNRWDYLSLSGGRLPFCDFTLYRLSDITSYSARFLRIHFTLRARRKLAPSLRGSESNSGRPIREPPFYPYDHCFLGIKGSSTIFIL